MTSKGQEAVAAVRAAVAEARDEGDLAELLGELERVRVEAVLRATRPDGARQTGAPADRVLTPQEAAERLGRSRWWVYRNKALLPLTHFPTGGWGVRSTKLDQWIALRGHDPRRAS